jgi:hypothetical protein
MHIQVHITFVLTDIDERRAAGNKLRLAVEAPVYAGRTKPPISTDTLPSTIFTITVARFRLRKRARRLIYFVVAVVLTRRTVTRTPNPDTRVLVDIRIVVRP